MSSYISPERRGPIAVAWLSGTIGVALPAIASACPACFGAASERVLHSYYGTALVLTLLPLVLLSGFALWVARQLRASVLVPGLPQPPERGGMPAQEEEKHRHRGE
jgi:hypothetical protein